MSFSMKKGSSGIPIALMMESSKSKKLDVIYFRTDSNADSEMDPQMKYLALEEALKSTFTPRGRTTLNPKDIDKLQEAVEQDERPKDQRLIKVYDKAMELIDSFYSKSIHAPLDAMIHPLPYWDKKGGENPRVYVFGQSGSGKSTFVSNFLCEGWQLLNKSKDINIYLISRKPEDKAFDSNPNVTRIPLESFTYQEEDEYEVDEETGKKKKKKKGKVKSRWSIDDFEDGSCVIFDDIDTLQGELKKAVWGLRDELLTMGRSKGICITSIAHIAMGNGMTKISVNESNMIVWFPRGVNWIHLNRLLRQYYAISDQTMKRIQSIKGSRWICLLRTVPVIILTEDQIFLGC